MIVVLAWPVIAAALAVALVLAGRRLTPQPTPDDLPNVPDWASPDTCPPAVTVDPDGNLQEVWS